MATLTTRKALRNLLTWLWHKPGRLAIAAVGSALLAITIGWLGDTLFITPMPLLFGDGCMASFLGADSCVDVKGMRLLLVPLLTLLIAAGMYFTLKHKLPPEIRKMRPATARPVLMALTSNTQPNQVLTTCDGQWLYNNVALPADLDNCIAALDDMASKWPWHNLLRAIQPHQHKLRALVLITTEESHNDFPQLREWLSTMLAGCSISELCCKDLEIDHNAQQIRQALSNLCKQAGVKSDEISIDITGTQKTLTIAATLATLDNDVSFQYVLSSPNQRGPAKVLECYSSVASQQQ